ncbi:hypothetical protein HAX54_001395, partial [Datura stramonium]|nr:hypothetical protein [Datura stramonium]
YVRLRVCLGTIINMFLAPLLGTQQVFGAIAGESQQVFGAVARESQHVSSSGIGRKMLRVSSTVPAASPVPRGQKRRFGTRWVVDEGKN